MTSSVPERPIAGLTPWRSSTSGGLGVLDILHHLHHARPPGIGVDAQHARQLGHPLVAGQMIHLGHRALSGGVFGDVIVDVAIGGELREVGDAEDLVTKG